VKNTHLAYFSRLFHSSLSRASVGVPDRGWVYKFPTTQPNKGGHYWKQCVGNGSDEPPTRPPYKVVKFLDSSSHLQSHCYRRQSCMGCEPKEPEPEPETQMSALQRWGIPENITEEDAQIILHRIFFGQWCSPERPDANPVPKNSELGGLTVSGNRVDYARLKDAQV